MTRARRHVLAAVLLGGMVGCGGGEPAADHAVAAARPSGAVYQVRDTTIQDLFRAAGTARAIREATLSTRLMGTVTSVTVQEGDTVGTGRELARIDSRELEARRARVEASTGEAQAVLKEAELQAARMRSLYADSAAPKAQLDAAETGLSLAQAAVRTAHAAAAELAAVEAYSVIRAPFAGIVTGRMVDPGDLAAPGAPLLMIVDASRLRITAAAAPDVVHGLHRGDRIPATIEGEPVTAVIEGIVPGQGNLTTVNALVSNPERRFMSGAAAELGLSQGPRRAILVPQAAIVRQGDLTGVHLAVDSGAGLLRWVKLGVSTGEMVEVVSGLRAGDRVVIPTATAGER
ncbi:MAG: efflux RND transporter periplasmic adaptor subunit [Gemmatimonadales bacterium]